MGGFTTVALVISRETLFHGPTTSTNWIPIETGDSMWIFHCIIRIGHKNTTNQKKFLQ
jgi:hypothetical protein